MFLCLHKPAPLSKRSDLIEIPTNMHRARAIRARHMLEPRRLRLAL